MLQQFFDDNVLAFAMFVNEFVNNITWFLDTEIKIAKPKYTIEPSCHISYVV